MHKLLWWIRRRFTAVLLWLDRVQFERRLARVYTEHDGNPPKDVVAAACLEGMDYEALGWIAKFSTSLTQAAVWYGNPEGYLEWRLFDIYSRSTNGQYVSPAEQSILESIYTTTTPNRATHHALIELGDIKPHQHAYLLASDRGEAFREWLLVDRRNPPTKENN